MIIALVLLSNVPIMTNVVIKIIDRIIVNRINIEAIKDPGSIQTNRPLKEVTYTTKQIFNQLYMNTCMYRCGYLIE